MVRDLAKDFYNKLYNLPPSHRDLEDFANLVINKFIEELEQNKTSVVWNYGLDSVVFIDKSVDGKESLRSIKERYLGDENNKSNPIKLHGAGTPGDSERNADDNLENKQS